MIKNKLDKNILALIVIVDMFSNHTFQKKPHRRCLTSLKKMFLY